MIKVLLNGEERQTGYTVENNLIPSIDNVTTIIKHLFYTHGQNRRGGGSSSTVLEMDKFMDTFYLSQGMLDNGYIELLDESNNVLSRIDLTRSYSGSDEKRGSINLNESGRFTLNGKIYSTNVLDFPTHASNGAIKKINFHSRPYFDYSCYSKFHTRNYRKNILFSSPDVEYSNPINLGAHDSKFNFCLDKDNNPLILIRNLKTGYYKGSKYKYNVAANAESSTTVFCINNKFYRYAARNEANKKYTLVQLIIDEANKTITDGEKFEISYMCHTSYPTAYPVAICGDEEFIYVLNCDSRNYYYYFSKLSLDGTLIDYKELYYSDAGLPNSYGFMTYPAVAWNMNADGCVYTTNTETDKINYYKIDFINKSIEKISNLDESIDRTLCINNSSLYETKNNNRYYEMTFGGKRYAIERASYNSSNGHISDFIIFETEPYKIPLSITLTEPLIKTSEQTMKLILDITIE